VAAAPDDRVRAEDAPRGRNRQVILPEVENVGTRRERDVRAVVDCEQAAVPTARISEYLEQREFFTRLKALLPQLHDVHPGAEDGVEELREVTLGAPAAGAKVEPRVRQPCPHIVRHRPSNHRA
jgi:hypothetical protein